MPRILSSIQPLKQDRIPVLQTPSYMLYDKSCNYNHPKRDSSRIFEAGIKEQLILMNFLSHCDYIIIC